MPTLPEYIKQYKELGLDLTPIHTGSKTPFVTNWPAVMLGEHDLLAIAENAETRNVAAVLGLNSGNIVDIDIDDQNARLIAPSLMPNTGFVFGRKSAPSSHYFYRCEIPGRTKKYTHPLDGRTIVELRGQGGCTVLPGSIHATGEEVRFEEGMDGEPASIDRHCLELACENIAVATVLADSYSKNRHDFALAFGGVCAKAGVDRERAITIMDCVSTMMGDDERDDRIQAVVSSYDNTRSGRRVSGIPALAEALGCLKTATQIENWLCGNRVPAQSSSTQTYIPVSAIETDFTSDLTSGESFCNRVGSDLIYCDDEDRFYVRKSGVYRFASLPEVKSMVMNFVKEAARNEMHPNDLDKLKGYQSVARINAIVEVAKAKLRVLLAEFDQNEFLAGCENGVLSLRTRVIIDSAEIVTKSLGTRFDPNAKCPRFDQFLHEVFSGDIEKIAFVQRAVGYALTGSTAAQCMFFAIGSGANGKSTFLKVVADLMGQYGRSLPIQTLMMSKYGDDKTDDLASLQGSRFVSGSEGEFGQKLAVAKVKKITGGDTISCRHLYGRYFDMTPQFKAWFATNDLPHISGNDPALWRRIHVISFPVNFTPEQRDPTLTQTLKAELPGILNWALEGVRQLGEMKGDFLDPPPSVRNDTRCYRSNSDSVAEFIDAACTLDGVSKVMTKTLHDAYVDYCLNSGIDPLSASQFGKDLGRLNITGIKTNKGTARVGIKLNLT